jgi:LysR family hydrogen peroxide-inducible transcriptional activator
VLDGGIMAGPLGDANVIEYPLYYEQFYAYVSPLDDSYSDREIDLESTDLSKVWLLANEHCLRGQIERLCKLKERSSESDHACRYESGSLDTLIHVVDYNPGFTIIPELHAMGLSEDRQGNLRRFKNKSAVREVSLVVSSDYVRRAMLNAITSIIRSVIPRSMQDPALKSHVVDL